MTKEQVEWRQFREERSKIGGDRCWRDEGVTVYHPTREIRNRTIVPYRFAINPTTETPRKIRKKGQILRIYMYIKQVLARKEEL